MQNTSDVNFYTLTLHVFFAIVFSLASWCLRDVGACAPQATPLLPAGPFNLLGETSATMQKGFSEEMAKLKADGAVRGDQTLVSTRPARLRLGGYMQVTLEESPDAYTHQNIGTFNIPGDVIFRTENLEVFRRMMADMIVIRCEYLATPSDRMGTVFHYTAISPQFVAIPQGGDIPSYRAELRVVDGCLEEIRWVNETAEKVLRRFKNAEGEVCEETSQRPAREAK